MGLFNCSFAIASTNYQNIGLDGQRPAAFGLAPATEPSLVTFALEDAFEEGEPNLFAALRWDYGLTKRPYGRDLEKERILAWAHSGLKAATARLVTGEGGAGKTRLAAEVALALKAEGWTAGFLPRNDTVQFQFDKGLFLIYDYPEEQPERTRLLFEKIAETKVTEAPVRVLFLSRRDFGVWQNEALSLEGRFGRQAIATPGPLIVADALSLIEEAARRFAVAAGLALPDLSGAEAWLEKSDTHRMPLFCSAAAIHSVLSPREPFGLDGALLMHDLARRELRRVRRASHALGISEYGLERLLALAVLGDGLNGTAIAALRDAGVLLGSAPDFLQRLKRTPWWREGRLLRLEPDRPAAAFVDLALFDQEATPTGDECLPDWLYPALEERAASFGVRLARILYDLSTLRPDAAGLHPLNARLIDMLTRLPRRAKAFETTIGQDLPHWSSSFAAEAALILSRLSPKKKHQRAAALTSAAKHLSRVGRAEAALVAAGEAFAIYSELAQRQPEKFVPSFASSLGDLAAILSQLGDHEAAADLAEEATGLYRDLAKAYPEKFAPKLALSLNNLGNSLSDLGRHQHALTYHQEAERLYRELTMAKQEKFKSDLAMSLNNVALTLYQLGRDEEAQPHSQESTDLYRELANVQPEKFMPDLAMALSNLGAILSQLSRDQDALANVEEAERLYRELARVQPEKFEAELAMSLNNLSMKLSKVGRREEALNRAQEAVELYRKLAVSKPKLFTSNIAKSLINLADALRKLGRDEEALYALRERERILASNA